MSEFSMALAARVQWALHRVSVVAENQRAAQTHLSRALNGAKTCGDNAAWTDENLACPALLADVPDLRMAFTQAFDRVREQRQKRRTRDGLTEELTVMAEEANRGCGQSYELFVKRFSADVDDLLEIVESPYQSIALDVAISKGYATPAEREKMQEEIAQDGGCSLTGIDPDYCPCGRHE
ncbi:hypothetical protein BSFA1_79730 (plasmid) [Burkholderia sp. SFA1]|nr:hypothetical protein BSFA1_79730 [Burkholderia sp. SFA1]